MRLRPLEAVNLAALAVLTTVTLLLWRRLANPGEILLRYALMGAFMAIVVFLVQRLDRLPKALRIAADFYPAAFIPFDSHSTRWPRARCASTRGQMVLSRSTRSTSVGRSPISRSRRPISELSMRWRWDLRLAEMSPP